MIELRGLSVALSGRALGPIELEIETGAYAVLAGPSGSGKTTLLEAIAGVRRCVSGTVRLGGVDVTDARPADRGVGFVPQDGVLFDTMSVRDNLLFGVRPRLRSREERRDRAAELADRLGLGGLLDRRPRTLSGGEKRRVAIGRALAIEPDVLLLDEPLEGLDPESRRSLRRLLAEVRERTACTVLHVSHDEADAAALADGVVHLRDGRLAPPPPRIARGGSRKRLSES